MRAALLALGLLAACERAEPPPSEPSVPASPPEPLTPTIIEEARTHVENPPPLPPGAAWYRRLTGRERVAVDWMCRKESDDPCWMIRQPSEQDAERLSIVRPLEENRDFNRHCKQVYGPPRGCNTPLVVSFDGDVTFSHDIRPFTFHDEPVASAWPTSATPWIALDRNGDGVIDRGSELFRFDSLAELDDNHDGVIDARDAAFASLVLWADKNLDRRSTPDELTPLSSVVTQIPLSSTLDARCTDGDCEGERGTAVTRDGKAAIVVDVYLRER